MRRLRRFVRNLLGGSDDILMGHLAQQIAATHQGADLAAEMLAGKLPGEEAYEKMVDIEHRGDEARARLVSEIGRALTTPIDREDLFRVSRSIDDILDNLRDLAREYSLYGVRATPSHVAVAEAIRSGIEELEAALSALAHEPPEASHMVLGARKEANQVRRMYQEGLASVVDNEITSEVIKRRELLRRLDVVGLRLGEAADALADGIMKRGY